MDAGEIGAGLTVTALYEIVPVSAVKGGQSGVTGVPAVDELKYRETEAESRKDTTRLSARWSELLTLKVRYKEPAGTVRRITFSRVRASRPPAASRRPGGAFPANARLRLVFQKQHFVNDGDFVRELDFHERAAHGLADVRGVHCFAAQNHTQTDDGGK